MIGHFQPVVVNPPPKPNFNPSKQSSTTCHKLNFAPLSCFHFFENSFIMHKQVLKFGLWKENRCLLTKVYAWIMKALHKFSEVNWILRGLVASWFYKRAWVICMTLEERTNDWPSHSIFSLLIIEVISQPHLLLNQLGPWRSQIFIDMFLARVASKLQNL